MSLLLFEGVQRAETILPIFAIRVPNKTELIKSSPPIFR